MWFKRPKSTRPKPEKTNPLIVDLPQPLAQTFGTFIGLVESMVRLQETRWSRPDVQRRHCLAACAYGALSHLVDRYGIELSDEQWAMTSAAVVAQVLVDDDPKIVAKIGREQVLELMFQIDEVHSSVAPFVALGDQAIKDWMAGDAAAPLRCSKAINSCDRRPSG